MAISESLGEVKRVEVSQGPIEYRERGGGAPIVFIHGILVNGDLWRDVVPAVANGHRCIAPDWPLGSHRTPMKPQADLSPLGTARLIDEFLAALDLSDVTIVANDTGGGLAQILVTEHPGRIGRLVLTNCDAFSNFPPHAFKPLLGLGYVPGGFAALGQPLRARAAQRLFLKSVAKRPVPDPILQSYARPAIDNRGVRRDFVRFFRQLRPRYTISAAEKLPAFDKPALVAWGTDDFVFPKSHGRRLAGLLPKSRFEPVPDSRAFVPEDQPGRLGELIRDFVGSG